MLTHPARGRCYVLDLDHDFAPNDRTREIHELYSRVLELQIVRP